MHKNGGSAIRVTGMMSQIINRAEDNYNSCENSCANNNTAAAAAAAVTALYSHKVSYNFFGAGAGSFSNTNNNNGHTMFFLPSDNMPLIKPDPAICKNERVTINIHKNRIQFNKRDGITIRHVVINELVISDNELSNNNHSGIWMQRVKKSLTAL